jgi:hypothetical protein
MDPLIDPAANKLQNLVSGISWLCKRNWGRAILLGFASMCALAAAGDDVFTQTLAFRVGFYLGTVFMPRETIGGHSVFGAAGVFVALALCWYTILRLAQLVLSSPRTRA